jgi:hypothetical protein
MRVLFFFFLCVFFYIVYGFYLTTVNLKIVPEVKTPGSSFYSDYRGAIHVRSSLSGGVRESDKIIESAQAAGLDFLIFTEHHKAYHKGLPNTYYDSLLVTTGIDYKYLDSKLLILGYRPESSSLEELSWRVPDWLTQKAPYDREEVLILSTPFNEAGQPTWGNEWPSGLDALEVQNSKVIAQREYRENFFSVLWSLIVYPFNPQYAFLRLYQDPVPELDLWDKMHPQETLSGVSGLDTSAKAIILPGSSIEFPSYQTSFELMSTHVLIKKEFVGSFEKDKKSLLDALKKGQVYFSLDLLGNPKGFKTYLKVGTKTVDLGEEILFTEKASIEYQLPSEPREFFEVVLFRNGQRIAQSGLAGGSFSVDKPGVYRLIVRVSPFFPLPDARKWVTWIYTNPFYLR